MSRSLNTYAKTYKDTCTYTQAHTNNSYAILIEKKHKYRGTQSLKVKLWDQVKLKKILPNIRQKKKNPKVFAGKILTHIQTLSK